MKRLNTVVQHQRPSIYSSSWLFMLILVVSAALFQSAAPAAGLLIADGGLGGALDIKQHDVAVVILARGHREGGGPQGQARHARGDEDDIPARSVRGFSRARLLVLRRLLLLAHRIP